MPNGLIEWVTFALLIATCIGMVASMLVHNSTLWIATGAIALAAGRGLLEITLANVINGTTPMGSFWLVALMVLAMASGPIVFGFAMEHDEAHRRRLGIST